ncbi:acetamidase/formamidase family protein [Bacillus cereus]|uniref:acetamidase/formamidase family protein n=1 Tax=Bacillus cereus TaxID=1396 RepID=UPI002ABFD0FF|nr:acetamidase/formamidase family protein [Bacillus cereus]MDZ4427717.1 acetamidase/formamidase family protein [Bacillus cereus]
MYRIHKDHIIYSMSPENKPCMEVEIGSSLVFETYDCFENQIDSEDVVFQELDWNRINPATGPVYVKGAEPGDILAVTIEKIKIAEQGVLTTGANLGVIGNELNENTVKIVPIHNEHVLFSSELQIPINPMIGVIGTAPKEESISCGTPLAIQKEKMMTIASEKLLDDAASRAVHNMVTFLHEELAMSKADATLLLSAAGNLKVCQVVDPLKTARMELGMDYVEKLGFTFSKFHIK